MSDDNIGIDIYKDRLDAVHLGDGRRRGFSSDTSKLRVVRVWLRATPPTRVVDKPTGPDHAACDLVCADQLAVQGQPARGSPPRPGPGMRTKTDTVDARMFAAMGAIFDLEPDRPRHADQHDLKEVQVGRWALVSLPANLANV